MPSEILSGKTMPRRSDIYFNDNDHTFNYALSEAITLSLFKMYKEDPVEFNEKYIAYLSTGTTMTPPEKLKKYFGIEIRQEALRGRYGHSEAQSESA